VLTVLDFEGVAVEDGGDGAGEGFYGKGTRYPEKSNKGYNGKADHLLNVQFVPIPTCQILPGFESFLIVRKSFSTAVF